MRCRGGGQLGSTLSAEEDQSQCRSPCHRAGDRHPGCIPYRERYEHDRKVAARRRLRYGEVLGHALDDVRTALDVGCANGAFVDYLRERGIRARGIDPDPAMARDGVETMLAGEVAGAFDLVTYHDVLEHVLDPAAEVLRASRLCYPGGLLVVDVPDVSVAAGFHHYKSEHPWYFTSDALRNLLTRAGFELRAVDRPVPGKIVLYGRRTG